MKIYSFLVWGLYGLAIVISFPLVLIAYILTAPFDKYRRVANSVFMFFGQSFTYLNPFWKINFYGLDRYDKNEGVIFVANHQSFVDMPLLARLPWSMKWVSKQELFKIPVAGWILSLAGHISIRRGSPEARKTIYKIVPYVQEGEPVLVFPEGTRSKDGIIGPFKRGAFMVAWEYNLPVQPIVISGTHKLMEPGSWTMKRKGNIDVSILQKIYPEHFSSISEFIDYTQEHFKEQLHKEIPDSVTV